MSPGDHTTQKILGRIVNWLLFPTFHQNLLGSPGPFPQLQNESVVFKYRNKIPTMDKKYPSSEVTDGAIKSPEL